METTDWANKYRCLQLMQARANERFKHMLASLKVLFLSVLIRSMYGVVKIDGALRLFNLNVAILGDGFLGVLLKTYGKVFEESERALLDRKVAIGDRRFRRFHQSCRPLTFEIGGLYFVDRGLSLTVGSFVAQSVAGMLILGA